MQMQKDTKLQGKSVEELQTVITQLAQQLAEKKLEISKKDLQLSHQQQTITQLMEQLRLGRQRQFGSKSERHVEDDPQALLFDEAELPTNSEEIEAADESITVASFERKKSNKKPGRKPLPDNLPREERIYDLTDEEKQCSCGFTREHR